MTEREALLRAILERPDDDLPRLVFADWLEGNDGVDVCAMCEGNRRIRGIAGFGIGPTPRCSACTCKDCDGKGYYLYPTHYRQPCKTCDGVGSTGRTPNGFAAQAEFIRVQCELSAMERCNAGSVVPSAFPDKLELREKLLFHGHGPTMFDELAGNWRATEHPPARVTSADGYRYDIARGFVSEINLPLAAFMEHAESLFRQHPITRVVLTDREPHGPDNVHVGVAWFPLREYPVGGRIDHNVLPDAIFDLLEGISVINSTGVPLASDSAIARFYSIRDALEALSDACVAYGRKCADLPPLEIASPSHALR